MLRMNDRRRTVVLAVVVACSGWQLAALKTAAGGASGANGFHEMAKFLDNIATYVIYLAIPAGALALIAGGAMLIAGNPKGPSWIASAAVGVGVVLLSKGIMA